MGVVAAFLVYGNLGVALTPGPVSRALGVPPLPQPPVLRDAFLLPGMFNSFSRRNFDHYIGGLRDDTGEAATRGKWIPIPVKEHFVQRHGITFVQLSAMHHYDVHGPDLQHHAWAGLARRIRARHNRLHPERRVRRIRFGIVTWPKSPEGYRHRKQAREIRTVTWYVEPEPEQREATP
ncbi:MAG: hypothetical protein PVI30_27310 [Myxococcales bacterium]|jgi:hypothetical protein